VRRSGGLPRPHRGDLPARRRQPRRARGRPALAADWAAYRRRLGLTIAPLCCCDGSAPGATRRCADGPRSRTVGVPSGGPLPQAPTSPWGGASFSRRRYRPPGKAPALFRRAGMLAQRRAAAAQMGTCPRAASATGPGMKERCGRRLGQSAAGLRSPRTARAHGTGRHIAHGAIVRNGIGAAPRTWGLPCGLARGRVCRRSSGPARAVRARGRTARPCCRPAAEWCRIEVRCSVST